MKRLAAGEAHVSVRHRLISASSSASSSRNARHISIKRTNFEGTASRPKGCTALACVKARAKITMARAAVFIGWNEEGIVEREPWPAGYKRQVACPVPKPPVLRTRSEIQRIRCHRLTREPD